MDNNSDECICHGKDTLSYLKPSHVRGLEEQHGNLNANCYWIFHACHTFLEEEPIAIGKSDYKENQEESHQGVDSWTHGLFVTYSQSRLRRQYSSQLNKSLRFLEHKGNLGLN